MPVSLTFPLSDETVHELHTGDHVLLNGIIITGRDTAHKWMHDRFISKAIIPSSEDIEYY